MQDDESLRTHIRKGQDRTLTLGVVKSRIRGSRLSSVARVPHDRLTDCWDGAGLGGVSGRLVNSDLRRRVLADRADVRHETRRPCRRAAMLMTRAGLPTLGTRQQAG